MHYQKKRRSHSVLQSTILTMTAVEQLLLHSLGVGCGKRLATAADGQTFVVRSNFLSFSSSSLSTELVHLWQHSVLCSLLRLSAHRSWATVCRRAATSSGKLMQWTRFLAGYLKTSRIVFTIICKQLHQGCSPELAFWV